MKSALLAMLGAASLVHAPALSAQSDVVSRYSRWEARLRDRVNDQLAYPVAASGASGDVLVGFRIDDHGKPAGVRVQHSSGNAIFDQAAVELVSRLGRLGPVPAAGRSMSEIVLKISYGDPAKTTAGSMQLVRADCQEQLANERRDRALVSGPVRVVERN